MNAEKPQEAAASSVEPVAPRISATIFQSELTALPVILHDLANRLQAGVLKRESGGLSITRLNGTIVIHSNIVLTEYPY